MAKSNAQKQNDQKQNDQTQSDQTQSEIQQEETRSAETAKRAVAPAGSPGDINPFQEIGNQRARRIIGQLMKFSKGDWLVGSDNTEIPLGTRMIANMDQLLRGWVRWEDNKPAEQIMGLVVEGFKPPKREALGWNDETEWETDDKGEPRDPWQDTYYILLRELDKDDNPMQGDEGLYTFTTASTGGKDAIIELCDKYGKLMRMRPNEYPIVSLSKDAYDHPNKQYGRIKKPVFKFNTKSDWIAKDKFGDISAPHEDSEGEEIPF